MLKKIQNFFIDYEEVINWLIITGIIINIFIWIVGIINIIQFCIDK